MTPDVVVDVGNSRIKWGRCVNGAVAGIHSLPVDDPQAWQRQLAEWGPHEPQAWAVAGVHPVQRDALAEWLRARGARVWVLDDPGQIPLQVRLEHPERVGIDRLLNAVAAVWHRARRRVPAVLVDAGSAVTVDWVDAEGTFRGGAIFPGLRLMAQALRDYTALLPLVQPTRPCPDLPGVTTTQAIEGGIYYAVAGGINRLINVLCARSPGEAHVFLTGGDAALLRPVLDERAEYWPEMTLEGLRHSAEAQP
ncbi:MAG: type III pantothenate kinase [Gemmataceae bacterium]|nr:type III pantothenate kinase [Gemmataceae bacterium]